ncbi:MAG: acyltransferase [Pirellulales bacterium]
MAETGSDSRTSGRLHSLDYGRGIASLLVVIFHAYYLTAKPKYFDAAPLPFHVDWGARGVDFFFVLSGFIIAYAHWNDLGRSNKLSGYLNKRWRRVYPIMWCVAIPFIAMSVAIRSEYVPKTVLGLAELSATSLLLLPSPNLPVPVVLWTLKHEILFYAIFAGMIVRPRWMSGFLMLWVAACFLHSGLTYPAGFLADFLFSPYNIEFALGVLCAAVARKRRIPFPTLLMIAGAIVLFAAAWFYEPVEFNVPWLTNATSLSQALQFGIGSALLILGVVQRDFEGRNPRFPPAALLGAASYSIYLVHFPVMSLVLKVLTIGAVKPHVQSFTAFLISVTAALIAGVLMHLWLEVPLLSLSKSPLAPPKGD